MSEPIRLAYLVSQYPAVNHAFMLREVQALRRLGFHVEVASIRESDRPFNELTSAEQQESARTYYVRRQHLILTLLAQLRCFRTRPFFYLKGAMYALRLAGLHPLAAVRHLRYFADAVVVGLWMKRQRLIHLHSHYTSNVALLVTRIFDVSVSMTMHGPDEFRAPDLFHLNEKVHASRFVSTISSFGRSQILMHCDPREWPKVAVSRLGVDTTSINTFELRHAPRVFELLCPARLAKVKGHRILLDAMKVLIASGIEVRLRLAGDGPEREDLEAYSQTNGLASHVIFHGKLNEEQLLELYRTADAVVLPSFAEGVPVCFMEAMAMGIPCVGTWVAGVPELIRDGKDGLLVAPGSADQLATAVKRLMEDSELRRQLGIHARVRAMEMADLATNVAHLADLFSTHVGAPAGHRDTRTQAAIEDRDAGLRVHSAALNAVAADTRTVTSHVRYLWRFPFRRG